MRRRTTNKDLARLLVLAEAGLSGAAIARDIGMSDSMVRRWAAVKGITLTRYGRSGDWVAVDGDGAATITPAARARLARYARCVALYQGGAEVRAICLAAGVSRPVVYAALHEAGATLRGRLPRKPPRTLLSRAERRNRRLVRGHALIARYEAGERAADLAASERVGMAIVYRLMREAGWVKPSARGRLVRAAWSLPGPDLLRLAREGRAEIEHALTRQR